MFKGKKVTVIGFGIEGTALARYLASQGASVTVSDARPRDALEASIEKLSGLSVILSLGANRVEDVLGADMVFVSQGVPMNIPALLAAKERDIPVSSMTKLFMDLCPGTVVGITGSAGKSTTTALTGEVLRAAGRKVFVGGNIGVPLLEQLPEMDERSWIVLEISHTQLEVFGKSPHVAAVTNIAPSHADRYTMDDYIALKKRIYRQQNENDHLVLNFDDPVTRAMAGESKGRVLFFSRSCGVDGEGSFLENGWIRVKCGGSESAVLQTDRIRLLGSHNLENVLAVCAMASACEVPVEAIASAVSEFRGVEHRLELVRSLDGVRYYNDSIATSPQRTVAGLRSFEAPVVLIAGGRDKHLPLEELAREVVHRCRSVVLYGEAAKTIAESLLSSGIEPYRMVLTPFFEDVARESRRLAHPGDVVLLSPACTSFDVFSNFEERGRRFKELVNAL